MYTYLKFPYYGFLFTFQVIWKSCTQYWFYHVKFVTQMPTCFFLSDQIILRVWRICDWDIYPEAWPHSLKAHNSKRLQDIEEDCLRTPTFTLNPPSCSYQILNHIVVIVALIIWQNSVEHLSSNPKARLRNGRSLSCAVVLGKWRYHD